MKFKIFSDVLVQYNTNINAYCWSYLPILGGAIYFLNIIPIFYGQDQNGYIVDLKQ